MRPFSSFTSLPIMIAVQTACVPGSETPSSNIGPTASRPNAVCTGVRRAIDGDQASIAGPPPGAGYELIDNGLTFETALKGPFPADHPTYYQRSWLSPSSYDGTGPSVGFEIRGCTTDCVGVDSGTQKINYHFLYSDPLLGLDFDTRRYIGFAMHVARDSPEGTPILFQLWQGSPHGPPMAAKLRTEANGSLTLFVDVLNNATGSNPSAPRLEVGSIPNFQKHTWYAFVLFVYPEHHLIRHRPGNVTLRLDYKMQGQSSYTTAFSYYGKWGYEPNNGCPYANQCDTQGPNRTIDFKFGIYRVAENSALQARFDNIRLTDVFSFADPDYACLAP